MSQQRKRVFFSALIVVTVAAMAVFLFVRHPRAASPEDSKPDVAAPVLNEAATMQSQGSPRYRNLSLQPEAFKLSRRLGRRFGASPEVSVIAGTLQIGSQRELVQITRRQSERGERLEIVLGTASLTWSETDGAKSGDSGAAGSARELIERLAFDSADQFVLAQLRGASYYTIAQNVRPADAGDAYEGSVWTIVRVDDPDRDEQRRPQSRWRLYYLNSSTQLIDKVVSEIQGRRVEANFSEWTELGGERVPGRITWTSEGQTLMEFELTSFTRSGL